MATRVPSEPDARLRAHRGPQPPVKVHVRSLTLSGNSRASWDVAAEHPSALDYLLASLATDLLSGLAEESRRAGKTLDDAELRLEVFLENPLVVAGVIGEEGSPRVAAIRGSLYVSSEAPETEIHTLWQQARIRSPVLASLAPGVSIDIQFKLVT